METFSFETHPDAYRHWQLLVEGPVARLVMNVRPDGGLRPGYELKLNSYDLGVDIELADAVQRLRFEHPGVRTVVVTSGNERVFCAGANIPMLANSTHAWKVNFCKFTNETRLSIEDASGRSGQRYLAALNGTTAGGGYELALACDHLLLVDDNNAAVSLPEVPLLGVLPGTGGLTRLVDKRRVRRDRADVFCTLGEGMKATRALAWHLVDEVAPKSRFDAAVRERAHAMAAENAAGDRGPGVFLPPLLPEVAEDSVVYRHVKLEVDPRSRMARLWVSAPEGHVPASVEELQHAGAAQWSLRAFRELDDALLRLRFHYPEVGVVLLQTRGDGAAVRESDRALYEHRDHWLAREILALQARVLRRLDLTAKTFFALGNELSCFEGVLLELALAADRFYMLKDKDVPVNVATSAANAGLHPMSHGLSRLETRFLGDKDAVAAALTASEPIGAEEADRLGLVTLAPDALDWDDEIRVAVEERVGLSPDALTAMEANLRFAGAESADSKIFARLSAWQNWVFQRPNAVGETGALTLYGKPTRPQFDYRRT